MSNLPNIQAVLLQVLWVSLKAWIGSLVSKVQKEMLTHMQFVQSRNRQNFCRVLGKKHAVEAIVQICLTKSFNIRESGSFFVSGLFYPKNISERVGYLLGLEGQTLKCVKSSISCKQSFQTAVSLTCYQTRVPLLCHHIIMEHAHIESREN